MDIIKELKEEHKKILLIFNEIEKVSSVDEKKGKIKELRTFMVEHLKKEDEHVYPGLAKCKNKKAVQLGDLFSDAMNKYAKEFLGVVDNILNQEDEISEDLILAYELITDKIKDRIIVEETILFPAFLNKDK